MKDGVLKSASPVLRLQMSFPCFCRSRTLALMASVKEGWSCWALSANLIVLLQPGAGRQTLNLSHPLAEAIYPINSLLNCI